MDCLDVISLKRMIAGVENCLVFNLQSDVKVVELRELGLSNV